MCHPEETVIFWNQIIFFKKKLQEIRPIQKNKILAFDTLL